MSPFALRKCATFAERKATISWYPRSPVGTQFQTLCVDSGDTECPKRHVPTADRGNGFSGIFSLLLHFLSQNRLQIGLRRADRGDVEFFHQDIQHRRGDEGRQARAEADVFNAQMQQRQQNGHCFLFVPA